MVEEMMREVMTWCQWVLLGGWLLLAAACTGTAGEQTAGGVRHPCQWAEWCVVQGGENPLCGGRWVCPAPDQPGGAGTLAVTTLRR